MAIGMETTRIMNKYVYVMLKGVW